MSQNKYSINLKVNVDHIDSLDHVNNVQYLHWVQDIAEMHWAVLSTTDINSKYVWVVLRHEIDYLQAAVLSDSIEIITWIGNTYGVKSERFVEIKKDSKLLARAKTIWCLLDRVTMKPSKIPLEIIHLLEINKG